MTRDKPEDGVALATNTHRVEVGFYQRHHQKILFLLLLFAPIYLALAAKVLTPGDMSAYLLDVSHWLPPHNQLIKDMERFSEVAGKERGSVIRISWLGCQLDDRRLYGFADAIKTKTWGIDLLPDDPGKSVFDDVFTVKDFVAKLKSDRIQLSDQQLYAQLENVLIGRDGTTCLMMTLPTRDPVLRSHAVNTIYDTADEVDGLDRGDLKLFGGPVYTSQIDRTGLEIATQFTPFSILMAITCAWFCLRNFWVMLAVFLNAIVATCFALVSMYLTEATMDPLLMLIPGFWFIMSVSTSLHFVNYYFEERETNTQPIDLGTATVKVALRPSFLAMLTTCIGLASLCTSEIMPIWRFGFHAALGLACSFVGAFLFMPSFLVLVSTRLRDNSSGRGDRFWSGYESFVLRFQQKTSLVFLILIAIGAIGFGRLGFSNKLRDQFAHRTKINSDTAWFEEQIGPVIPIEILIRFPKNDLPRPSRCLQIVNQLQNKINELELPTKTLSATAIVPFEAGSGARQAIFRTVLDKRITKHRQAMSQTGYVIDETDHELWRLTVFVFNSVDTTMSEYFTAIQNTIAQQRRTVGAEGAAVSYSFAGLGSRMAVITSELGGGLVQSVFVSAVLISLVVIISLRSFILGIVAMIPNIFPIVMSFGTYGFFQSTLDIGSIMTASIAMGIAVDDTIHFMYWFKTGIGSGNSRDEAIQLAIRKSGRAIAATSLICGLGFLVYFFCDFMPVARFGQLLFIMLGAALIGDLFFLPALLRSLPTAFLRTAKQTGHANGSEFQVQTGRDQHEAI